MSTQTPLWKQLLGACAGAAVAVLVYEAFLFASPHLQALITLPTAPGVENQEGTNLKIQFDPEAKRQAARNKEIAERFGQAASSSSVAWVAASSAMPLHAAASSQAASSVQSSAAGLKGVINSAKTILGTNSSSVAVSSRASSWSSSWSSSSWAARSSVRAVPTSTASVVTKGIAHGESLPNSGVGLWVIASAAFGATFERYRIRRKFRGQANA